MNDFWINEWTKKMHDKTYYAVVIGENGNGMSWASLHRTEEGNIKFSPLKKKRVK